MAADAPMGPMDAARSMEVENWDAPAEHWPADPVGHPTHMSDTNYRARAEVQIGIQQQVARAGLELLVDAKGGRDTDADAGQAAGAGGPRPTLPFDDTLAGVGVGAVRIDQQVEGGQCDLLVNATGAPSARAGASELAVVECDGTLRTDACGDRPGARASGRQARRPHSTGFDSLMQH